MDSPLYLALYLLLALGFIALLSAGLTRARQRQDARDARARQMRAALQRYSEWVGAQRLVALFQGEGPEAAAALNEACTLRLACFPELAGPMAELLGVHNRIVNFLATQQTLFLNDPERWLASEHDQRFMALWRQHQYALQELLARLEGRTSNIFPRGARESTYA